MAMVSTTFLFVRLCPRRWQWPWPALVALAGGLGVIDLSFATANLTKLHDGGWLPVTIAALVLVVMVSWRRGMEGVGLLQRRFTEPLDDFVAKGRPAGCAVSRAPPFSSRAAAR